jgi:hypothetical protein
MPWVMTPLPTMLTTPAIPGFSAPATSAASPPFEPPTNTTFAGSTAGRPRRWSSASAKYSTGMSLIVGGRPGAP